jgi:hypothetical protein
MVRTLRLGRGDQILSAFQVNALRCRSAGGPESGLHRAGHRVDAGHCPPDRVLLVRLQSKSGAAWGALSLYREPGRRMFDKAEKAFLQAIAPHLAEGARRALLVGEATDPETPDAPGLVILTTRSG